MAWIGGEHFAVYVPSALWRIVDVLAATMGGWGAREADCRDHVGKCSDITMNIKRMRGRTHRSGGSGQGGGGGPAPRHYNGNIPLNRNHVFDSSGPDLRVRGTAQQLFEKYLQLGRDATGAGDRVMAESYFQHAEHYFRILNAINQASQQSQPQQQQHYQNNNNPNPQNQNHTPQPNPGGHAGGQYNGHRRRNEEGYENDEQQGGYDEQPAIEQREIPIAVTPE
jgi:hypothetical protein